MNNSKLKNLTNDEKISFLDTELQAYHIKITYLLESLAVRLDLSLQDMQELSFHNSVKGGFSQ